MDLNVKSQVLTCETKLVLIMCTKYAPESFLFLAFSVATLQSGAEFRLRSGAPKVDKKVKQELPLAHS